MKITQNSGLFAAEACRFHHAGKGEAVMNNETIVDPTGLCPEFRRGLWSLEEEPAACENCEYYDEGRCLRRREAAAGEADQTT